ncbi:glycosyltransferase [Candidatus Daviesbacteria bacterium]|nr:glycosyltransferase [Candidatus Daviesbacteria bacterium]
MKVALVHDDLVQWGGAERMLLGLCEIYPDAPLFTSVYDRDNLILQHHFGTKKIITSFLQKISGWRSLYKILLPFYPIAFEQFVFDEYDLVISSTSRFAKSIVTKPRTIHICYTHTPPRFLWHFSQKPKFNLGEVYMNILRFHDQVFGRRVDYFIASSENAKRRIKRVYRKDADVVYPFVDLERFKDVETFDGGYFVVVGRSSKYKRFDLAIEACSKIGVDLKMISGKFSDEIVVKILAGCKALIIPGVEDFGIVSLEAQALGKPVIAFRQGGAVETVDEGRNGIFFEEATAEALAEVLTHFSSNHFNTGTIKKGAEKFSKENFIKNFKQAVASIV